MKLFTCALTSPAQAVTALVKAGVYKNEKIFTLPVGELLKDPEVRARARGSSVLLVLTYEDFVRNLGMLNKWTKDVIVFCSAIQAARFSSANHTDALIDRNNPATSYRFIPFKASAVRDGSDTDTVVIEEEYLHKYIETVREGSVLNKLMTVVYRLGNASEQKRIREILLRWFVEGDGDRKLLSQILAKEVKNKAEHQALVDICFSSTDYLAAFAEVNKYKRAGKQPNYKSVEKKFPGLDMYDIRYMLKSYEKINYSRDIAGKTLKQIYWGHERNSSKLKAKGKTK